MTDKKWALYYAVLKVGKQGTWVACSTWDKTMNSSRVCLYKNAVKDAEEEKREMIEVDIDEKMKEKIIRVHLGIYADEM